jgi:DNA-binding YbaB/EbfC family protein
MANMMQMLGKAQKLKSQMQDMQTRVQRMDVEGSAGGSAVTCIMSGKFELKTVHISPDLIKVEEKEVLEDLIVAAVNDARIKAEKTMAEETQKLIQSLGLPPGFEQFL